MAKAEISWKRLNEDGIKIMIYAHHFGRKWHFYQRQQRYDQWQTVVEPPLEDWLELLGAVRRRANRRLHPPEVEQQLLHEIRCRFPEWEGEGGEGDDS